MILLQSRSGSLLPCTSSGNLESQIACSHICHHIFLTSLSLSNFTIKIKIATSPQQICSQRETVLGAAGFGVLCQRHKSAVDRYYWFVPSAGVGFFLLLLLFSVLKYSCSSHRAVFLSVELPREFLSPTYYIFQHLSANLPLPVFGLVGPVSQFFHRSSIWPDCCGQGSSWCLKRFPLLGTGRAQ